MKQSTAAAAAQPSAKSNHGNGRHNRERRNMTTGDVAKIAQVATRTVAKWFDQGMLPGFRIPGSNDRRFIPAEVRKFLVTHGMPTDRFDRFAAHRILLVTSDDRLAELIIAALAPKGAVLVKVAGNSLDAGIVVESWRPNVVLVDFAVGERDSRIIGRTLRENSDYRDAKRVALVGEDEADEQPGWDDTFKKPFDPEHLAVRVTRAAWRGAGM